MVDCINFPKEFLNLSIEEIKTFNVNKIKIKKEFLIFYLIRENKIEIVKNLINELDLDIINYFGDKPIHWACFCKRFEIVILFLNKLKVSDTLNLNINSKNRSGYTPLYYACYRDDFEMVKILLENGAIPEVDEEGNYKCLKNTYYKYQKEN